MFDLPVAAISEGHWCTASAIYETAAICGAAHRTTDIGVVETA
jgi:hypothetical protein